MSTSPAQVDSVSLDAPPAPRPLLYATTIFIGAFLLFQVQPMIAKIILPWFGGTAAVWTTCMLFFQVALLLGYLYAHWLTGNLNARQQAMLHGVLLVASLAVLPVIPSETWKPTGSDNPTWRILGLLGATIGLPYLVLSTTSPLLQAWHARTRPSSSTYRLFALSNLASMLALASYPAVLEPRLGTRLQAQLWSVAYAVYALLAGSCALRSVRRAAATVLAPGTAAEGGPVPRPAWTVKVLWMSLAACGSTLLLAFTTHLSLNIAPIPFLWVLPLGLYLLSFIICFERDSWYHRGVFLPLTILALGGFALQIYGEMWSLGVKQSVLLFGLGLFICTMTCHGEMTRLKPHPRYLTSFYLMVSVGGALGGVFVGLVAPQVFHAEYELPIGLVACAALVLVVHFRDPASVLFYRGRTPGFPILLSLAVALCGYLIVKIHQHDARYRLMARSFYGSLRVSDWGTKGGDSESRELTHGTINHGEQWLAPSRRREATTYYGPSSGMGLAINNCRRNGPQRVGVIGLGSGVILTYGRAGDYYRIYEIDPLVLQIARTQFTFLEDCPAHPEIALGDARLSLEREPSHQFDVLVVDAFSSDSIPIHLLTREAFTVYFRHLKPDGILAVHVSNQYLELAPVVEAEAKALGKSALLIDDEETDGYFGSTVVLVSGSREMLAQRTLYLAGSKFPTLKSLRLWTDDYSNLFEVLK